MTEKEASRHQQAIYHNYPGLPVIMHQLLTFRGEALCFFSEFQAQVADDWIIEGDVKDGQ